MLEKNISHALNLWPMGMYPSTSPWTRYAKSWIKAPLKQHTCSRKELPFKSKGRIWCHLTSSIGLCSANGCCYFSMYQCTFTFHPHLLGWSWTMLKRVLCTRASNQKHKLKFSHSIPLSFLFVYLVKVSRYLIAKFGSSKSCFPWKLFNFEIARFYCAETNDRGPFVPHSFLCRISPSSHLLSEPRMLPFSGSLRLATTLKHMHLLRIWSHASTWGTIGHIKGRHHNESTIVGG
jgi:hypothetical protein